jgi:phospholipid transport system transporter-binding protein
MASEFKSPVFEVVGQGRAAVSGTLSFATAGELLSQGSESIKSGEAHSIDLAGVNGTDSAGLALLIEWLSLAQCSGQVLRYENIPNQLHQLATLSEVDELLSGSAPA